MRTLCGTILTAGAAVSAFAVHGAAILGCYGLVTEKKAAKMVKWHYTAKSPKAGR